MQRTRWVYQSRFSFFDSALVTRLIDIRTRVEWIVIKNLIAAGRQMVISGDASSCVHKHLVFWAAPSHGWECFRVGDVSSRSAPQFHASYRLYVSLNALKSSRRSGSCRSQSQPARLPLPCPRSNWRESRATREPLWRSSLPPKHQQDSERAGETSCRPSLESHILSRWGASHLPTWSCFPPFSTTWCLPQLTTFVAEERKSRTVYPPADQVFTWTQMCDIRDVSLTAEKPQNTHAADKHTPQNEDLVGKREDERREGNEPFKPRIPTNHFALIDYWRNRCMPD